MSQPLWRQKWYPALNFEETDFFQNLTHQVSVKTHQVLVKTAL